MIFLDTNIFLRFILKDHPLYSPKAVVIFEKIDQGKAKIYVSWLVIFEVVFVLQNSNKLPKKTIVEILLPILYLKNVSIQQKYLLEPIFKYYVDKNVSLADAYNVALMEKKKVKEIYSFDEDFDKFSQIKRLES